MAERRPRQAQKKESQGENPSWEVSMGNVRALFENWPVLKLDGFAALEEKTDISRSWYMRLSGALVRERLITEIKEPKEGNRVPKKLSAESLYRVALLAQALKDQGLLFIESPQRTYAIDEFVQVMEAEQSLC